MLNDFQMLWWWRACVWVCVYACVDEFVLNEWVCPTSTCCGPMIPPSPTFFLKKTHPRVMPDPGWVYNFHSTPHGGDRE